MEISKFNVHEWVIYYKDNDWEWLCNQKQGIVFILYDTRNFPIKIDRNIYDYDCGPGNRSVKSITDLVELIMKDKL